MDKSFEEEETRGKKAEDSRIVSGTGRRRFMEKDEEALCPRSPPVHPLLLLSVRLLDIIHHHVL